jgi:uncharacterized protein YodC (DUF2158 family)
MYQPGDVVRLKSGGVNMTVLAVNGPIYEVVWIDHDGNLCRTTLPDVVLAYTRDL